MISKLISILRGEGYSNAFQTCKYSHRSWLFECYNTNLKIFSQKRIFRMLSRHISILTKDHFHMLSKHLSILIDVG